MAYNYVTVTGSFPARSGTVTFTCPHITDLTGSITVQGQGPVTCTLSGGSFSTQLLATDNVGLLPPAWSYQVNVALAGSNAYTYPVLVPAAGGTTATLASLPVSASGGGASEFTVPLPITQGGTGQEAAAAAYNALSPMAITGDIEYESANGIASRLAGNTASTKNFLTSTGSGGTATAPAWGTIASADVSGAVAGLGLIASFEVSPQDVGLAAWTANPAQATTAISYPIGTYSGKLLTFLARIPVTGTVSNIVYAVDVAGGGLSNCYLGLYSTGGSLVAQCTADQSTNFTSVAPHTVALSAPYSASAGLIRVGLVMGAGGTAPSFVAMGAELAASFTNMGITAAANYLVAQSGTQNSFTALPATYSPAGASTLAGQPVFILS